MGWDDPEDLGFVHLWDETGRYYPFDPTTATEYTLTDAGDMSALGCSPLDPADAGDDQPNLECAIQSTAGAQCRILRLPAGTYRIGSRVNYDDVNDCTMLIGVGDTSHIQVDFVTLSSGKNGPCRSASAFDVCPNDAAGGSYNDQPWTAGFTVGTTDITIGNSAAYDVGDYVLLKGLVPNPDPKFDIENNENLSFFHMAKIESKNGNILTMDMPLNFDMTGGTLREASDMSLTSDDGALRMAGIEDIKFTYPTHTTGNTDRWHIIATAATDQFFMRGVSLEDTNCQMMSLHQSRRFVVEGNRFSDDFWENSNNCSAVYITSSARGVFENNYTTDLLSGIHRFVTLENGPNNIVVAYNFYADGSSEDVTRFVFFHGDHPHNNLVEGNSTEPGGSGWIEMDNFYGRSYKLTFFRNRAISPWICHKDLDNTRIEPFVQCVVDGDCAGSQHCAVMHKGGILTDIHDMNVLGNATSRVSVSSNIILNAVNSFHEWKACRTDGTQRQADTCDGFDNAYLVNEDPYDEMTMALEDTWMEENLSTNYNMTFTNEDFDMDCGDGTGDKDNCLATNTLGTAHSCAGDDFPDSLYREMKPEWWCDEACPWEIETGIGACADDISPDNVDTSSSLCKLPAQILAEGGNCTLSGSGGGLPEGSGGITGGIIRGGIIR
jgi:hypothetical protein